MLGKERNAEGQSRSSESQACCRNKANCAIFHLPNLVITHIVHPLWPHTRLHDSQSPRLAVEGESKSTPAGACVTDSLHYPRSASSHSRTHFSHVHFAYSGTLWFYLGSSFRHTTLSSPARRRRPAARGALILVCCWGVVGVAGRNACSYFPNDGRTMQYTSFLVYILSAQ
jgi:hypothetical protein